MNPIMDQVFHAPHAFVKLCASGNYGITTLLARELLDLREATSWRLVSDGDVPVDFVLVAGVRYDGVQWRCAAKHLGDGDFRGGLGDTLRPTWWMPLPDHPEDATPQKQK